MKKLILIIILNSTFLILNSFCFAQSKKIDSLLFLLQKDKADTNKVNHLNILGREVMMQNPDTAIALNMEALDIIKKLSIASKEKKEVRSLLDETYSNLGAFYYYKADYQSSLNYYFMALNIAEELKNKTGITFRLSNIGVAYLQLGDYPKALDYYFMAIRVAEGIGNKEALSTNLGNIGIVYRNQGEYPKALDYFLKALKIDEELKNKNKIARNLCNIGTLYYYLGDYSKSLDFDFKALKMAEDLGDNYGIAIIYGNIGSSYDDQALTNPPPPNKEYLFNQALEYYFKALKMSKELGNKKLQANTLGNIGEIYREQAERQLNLNKIKTDSMLLIALNYYFMALKIAEEISDKNIIANQYSNVGTLYTKIGKFKDAELNLKKAIDLNDTIGALVNLKQSEDALSNLYDITGRHKEALIHYKKAIALKDTLFSQENKKQLVRKEMNYEFDKKEAITKSENEKQQAVAEEKNHRQKIITWSVTCGLFLVVVFAGFVFRSLRITRKQKNIIEFQKNEVSEQKEIVEKQKHIVEEKQKEIVDSITYARRIQRALLTSHEYIKNNLPAEHFILFKPKDIVSGDFYWAYKSPAQTGIPLFYFAVGDCTGHGVPGAFMSMLNISYLNENIIERKIRLPHDILNAQRSEIIKALNPPGSREVSKDGMDCILCAFDFDKMLLHFTAANNPLWILRSGEMIEYKADKMPVGRFMEEIQPFTLQTIELQKGDIIYAATDGFADQFGTNGKKLMKKLFKEELIKIHERSLNEQKEYLDKFFENWKGNTEQVDDVTIIGIRI